MVTAVEFERVVTAGDVERTRAGAQQIDLKVVPAGGIDVPALVITSSADTLISPDLSKEMADAIPGARLETIDGAGHLSNLEAPEAFDALVRDFVSKIES